MAKEKFILVSLKEDQSKKLAQVISNNASRKILDYLSEKDATESELSEKLGMPLSTIHYNIQALVKGKLVEAEEFHYSKKGKEVLHYRLASKFIIIAPKSTFGLKEKLRSILPVGLLGLAGSLFLFASDFVQQLTRAPLMGASLQTAAEPVAAPLHEASRKSAESAIDEAARAGTTIAVEDSASAVATNLVEEEAENIVVNTIENDLADSAGGVVEPVGNQLGSEIAQSATYHVLQNPAIWFLFGCVFTVVLIILVEYINYKRKN